MLSSTSDYAIRAVLFLAGDTSRARRTDEIALATGAPRNYMGKTLNSLAKAGLLHSSRGPQGGFSLAVDPATLSLAQVIDCFVEARPHTRCLLGDRLCDASNPCAAHRKWQQILSSRREPLTTTTIADLLGANRK